MFRPLPLKWSLSALALLGLVLGFLLFDRQPGGRLQVMFPAVAGDAALILTPNGQTILIDGGADGAALATWLGHQLPFATRRIDLLILSRPDEQTLSGQLATIKRYRIGQALIAATGEQTSQLAAWRQLLAEQQSPVYTLDAGEQIRLGDATMHVLTAEAGRATLVLRWQQAVVYFLQAIDDATEVALEAQALPPATLVVFPWARPTNVPLLQRLQPSTIVFSEGGEHDPQQSFAQRQVGQARLLHKDINGEIRLMSDGRHTEIEVEREDLR